MYEYFNILNRNITLKCEIPVGDLHENNFEVSHYYNCNSNFWEVQYRIMKHKFLKSSSSS